MWLSVKLHSHSGDLNGCSEGDAKETLAATEEEEGGPGIHLPFAQEGREVAVGDLGDEEI